MNNFISAKLNASLARMNITNVKGGYVIHMPPADAEHPSSLAVENASGLRR